MTRQLSQLFQEIPGQINDSEMLHFLYTKDVNWKHVNAIKEVTELTDDVLSDWFNISAKTFREYRKPETEFKENIKEKVFHLLSLVKYGAAVFGSVKEFGDWLNTANFYFDNRQPATFLTTVTGAKFLDERLTAIEFGDNV